MAGEGSKAEKKAQRARSTAIDQSLANGAGAMSFSSRFRMLQRIFDSALFYPSLIRRLAPR